MAFYGDGELLILGEQKTNKKPPCCLNGQPACFETGLRLQKMHALKRYVYLVTQLQKKTSACITAENNDSRAN